MPGHLDSTDCFGAIVANEEDMEEVPSGSSLANPPTSNLMPLSIGLLGSVTRFLDLSH
mgnify:CR=1 FL=1